MSEIGPSREKYWDELDDSGKIQRLNFALKQQNYVIKQLVQYANELRVHRHLLNGEIVKKIENPGQIMQEGIRLPNNGSKWL